ncbi:MAG: hypothetical protein GX895_03650 [Clostridiales bacterium]|nr:hypothetical protein [Clostridium sp. N3C]NLZ47874.1 hypothetical protein [Clostridiales bacterium]SCN26262.1 hypothetical protein N3C_2752 [Clostridium sp. N3C]
MFFHYPDYYVLELLEDKEERKPQIEEEKDYYEREEDSDKPLKLKE